MGQMVGSLNESEAVRNKKTADNQKKGEEESPLERALKFDRESCKIKNTKNQRPQDDVTQAPLRVFPFKCAAECPSHSDEPSMSSIVATTLKDDSSNVNHNGINTSKMIPKRSWSGYQLFHLTNSKGDRISTSPRLIRSPKIRPNNSKNLISKKSISSVLSEPVDIKTDTLPRPLFKGDHLGFFSYSEDDKNKESNSDMEQLITMMRNHKVSDDPPAFNFSFEPPKAKNNNKLSSRFIPPPEFQFSLSTNIPQSNHIHSCTTEEEHHSPEDSFNHLQHRRILPLPKPRWKRSSTTIPSTWPWKDAADEENKQHTETDPSDFLFFPSGSTDSRDKSKKMKRSGAPTAPPTEEETDDGDKALTKDPVEEFRNSPRRKESKWRSNKRTIPNVVFDFTLDETTKEKLKELSNLKNKPLIKPVPPPQPVKSTSSKTTMDPLKPVKKESDVSSKAVQLISKKLPANQNKRAPNAHKKKKTKAANGNEEDHPEPPQPPPVTKDVIQQKKTPAASTTTTNTKKNKKRNNKKEVEIAPGGFLSSDVTLFQNPISDDWICLFCQYDILCYGLEETRKKTGYYRRKRERLRRIKEAELRRMGSLSESEAEDDHSEGPQHL
ncbi:hypothetical protein BDB01DRAFT_786404 [Pilobolus umbonatus]|nr:hypothetical protein BDB01DRAFT_786404 [Pilobolus umbonatus]